jgi:membrane-bound metal-dependent hydrolase YbcI (DUF457 family)
MVIFYHVVLAQMITHTMRWLAYKKNWGVVRASSILTLLVFLILPSLAPLALGATFVGFTLPEKMGWRGLSGASLIFTLIYFFCFTSTSGIGGSLGLFALIACLSCNIFNDLITNPTKKMS